MWRFYVVLDKADQELDIILSKAKRDAFIEGDSILDCSLDGNYGPGRWEIIDEILFSELWKQGPGQETKKEHFPKMLDLLLLYHNTLGPEPEYLEFVLQLVGVGYRRGLARASAAAQHT